MCRIYSLQTWCDSIGEFRLIDRYGLHLKVIHNDVTDRLAQLLKQCSYYLQQQQKPMEVSIGIVFMYINFANIMSPFSLIFLNKCRYKDQVHKGFIVLVLLFNFKNYHVHVIPVCVCTIFFSPCASYFIQATCISFFYLNGIYFISFAHVLEILCD